MNAQIIKKSKIINGVFLNIFNPFFKILFPFRRFLIAIFFAGVILDIFLNSYEDTNLFLLCILWILIIKLLKFKSDITFKVILIFIAIFFCFFIINPEQLPIDRVSTWIFLFLIIGIMQQFREVAL